MNSLDWFFMLSSSEYPDSFFAFMLLTPTFSCESESEETGWPKPYECPLTSHEFGLAVNKFGLPVREVPLAGMVEDLEEGAFF